LTARLEKTVLTEKMIEDDLSGLRRVQPNPHANWVLGLRDLMIRVRRVLLSSFPAPPTTKRRKQSNPLNLTTYSTQNHSSTPREK
jgi:hypothetical protein